LNRTHYSLSFSIIYRTYILLSHLSSKKFLQGLQSPRLTAKCFNRCSAGKFNKNKSSSTTLFFKFIPLVLSFSGVNLGSNITNSALYAVNFSGAPYTFSIFKSLTAFSKLLMFVEYIITYMVPFLILSTKLLNCYNRHFYNHRFFKVGYFRQYNIMKFFSSSLALLTFPQKAISILEALHINVVLMLSVNYHFRLLSLFSKKSFFTIGLVDSSVNSHAISLPFIVNKTSLMQQVLTLRLLFYIKSRSDKVSFNRLKLPLLTL
jgi:hypothetical protein